MTACIEGHTQLLSPVSAVSRASSSSSDSQQSAVVVSIEKAAQSEQHKAFRKVTALFASINTYTRNISYHIMPYIISFRTLLYHTYMIS